MSAGGLRERWIGLRNRLFMDRGFQQFAGRFPLTRGVTRARARAIFDIGVGYVYAQVAAVCVRLRVLDALRDGPLGLPALAAACNLPEPGMGRLALAAATLGFLEPLSGERWALGPQGAALLGNPGLKEMIAHHALLYADLADPAALLRGERAAGQLSAFWPYARGEQGEVGSYSSLMAATQPMISDQALPVLPLRGAKRLLDVGGGEGAFLIAAAKAHPGLEVCLFDLPAVAERAAERFAAAGLSQRASVASGDFRRDVLPRGACAVSLVRVVHDHDDDDAMTLLRAAHQAVKVGGRLLLVEPMSDTRGAEPMGDAYFGFYLLAMGSGRPRSFKTLSRMALEAGWTRPRELKTALPLVTRVLEARKESDRTAFSSIDN